MTTTVNNSAKFLQENEENGDYNQYWYSEHTLNKLVEDLLAQAQGQEKYRIAFLSAPSVYFALPSNLRESAFFFDIDKKWEKDNGYVYYDFNKETEIPPELHGTFDLILVDPPFITADVWQKYAVTTKLLLRNPDGKVILTTVLENADLLHELLGASPTAFKSLCPNLVYLYNVFTNYPSVVFSAENSELL
mmetsp:Transcript_33517/g.92583  ORF Transcript_33517/g.92583 Transcript_33517/m.92583 type:complete len:191 (+) Transcript_33517:52-624(+)